MMAWLAGGALVYCVRYFPQGMAEMAAVTGAIGLFLAHLKEPRP